MSIRSALYAPGDRPQRFGSALNSGADAVIFDLEDAVAPARKDTALSNVIEIVTDQRGHEDRPALWVRVDSERIEQDVPVLVQAGVERIVIPKAELALLRVVDSIFDAGLPDNNAPGLIALIETAKGLLEAAEIAHHPRVFRFGLGEADLRAELGTDPDAVHATEHLLARSMLVVASAAAKIEAPLGPVYPRVDAQDLRESSVVLRKLGFRGRTVLHPDHLDTVHDVFRVDETALVEARRIVAEFNARSADGHAAFVDSTGRFVDAAIAREARRLLADS